LLYIKKLTNFEHPNLELPNLELLNLELPNLEQNCKIQSYPGFEEGNFKL